ncbi:MAG: sigma 54-interacting transcriptional regulator [Acidobacteriaceae bacterium]
MPPEIPPSAAPALNLWLSGPSAAITQLRGQIRRVAPYFRTALLIGERGCGEESAAHILHQLSPLGRRPFVGLTAAEAERIFSKSDPLEILAEKGMLYLPRPERLPHTAQMALLRLIRRRGAQAPRIVAFAERGLRPLVSASSFSSDLADCLGALRIVIPPLRERREDTPHLLAHIVEEIAVQTGVAPPQLAPDLLEMARKLSWPGNLTQLYSAAEGLLQQGGKFILDATDLESVLGAIPQATAYDRREVRMMRLDDVIQEHIRAVLFACNGNKLRTAEILGISRSTLYRMLDAAAQPASPARSDGLQMTG